MRNVVLILLNLLFIGAYSQVVLDQNDFGTSGDKIDLRILNLWPGGEPIWDKNGASQTWDFTGLLFLKDEQIEYKSISSFSVGVQLIFNNLFSNSYKASYSVQEPGIDFTTPIVQISDYHTHYRKTNSLLEAVGYSMMINGVELPAKYNQKDKLYNFPLQYNDTNYSLASYGQTIPSLGYISGEIERTYKVDGWGTLQLGDSILDVLRVVENTTRIDSLYLDQFSFGSKLPPNRQKKYSWIKKGMKYPVFEIITRMGNVIEVRIQKGYDSKLSINENTGASFVNFYPNPTSNSVQIQSQGQISLVEILDVTGKLIYSKELTGQKMFEFDFQEKFMKQGTYIIKVTTDQAVDVKKILFVSE